jgi:hypothetical protein
VFALQPARFANTVFSSNEGGDGVAPGNAALLTAGSGGHGGFDFASSSFGGSSVILTSCAVVGNLGGNPSVGPNGLGGNGGGATGATAFTAVSSTFAGNVSGTPTVPGSTIGGLAVGGFMVSTASLTNCVLWGNLRGGLPSDADSIGIATQANACDIGASTGTFFGAGNFSADPLFVNLPAGDVHLTAASPCRDVGIGHVLLSVFDFEGDPRITGSATDLGADEFDGLPGSREDLALALTVNGAFPPSLVTANPAVGDLVSVSVTSPGGSFASDLALLASEVWLPPNPPISVLPDLQISLGFSVVTVWGGVGAGQGFGAVIPPGLGGLALRMQAFCLTPVAENGAFAASAARDVVF